MNAMETTLPDEPRDAGLEGTLQPATRSRSDVARRLRAGLRALRLHQWAKNLLVFVPLVAAHRLGDGSLFVDAVLAFLAFGLCASSAYVLNDLVDIKADRRHPRKRLRPFASGVLPPGAGVVLVPALLAASIAIALALPGRFLLVLAGYYALTLAYSFALKRIVLVDAVALAALYAARILAGAQAVQLPLSNWLLLFAVFLFFSLALVKRYAELDALRKEGRLDAAGRDYQVADLPILHSLGTASAAACVLVLALYLNSPAVLALYREPNALWLLCVLLLYWLSRVWLKGHRGEMHDDPVVFALKDRVSLCVALFGVLAMLLAA
jgi:4-hydroxybenzoate polyprenyltransferase